MTAFNRSHHVRRWRLTLAAMLLTCGVIPSQNLATGQEIVDQWRMTTEKPDARWYSETFDASQWQQAFGGFGTRGTPGARFATEWNSSDIWLRKSFSLETIPNHPALLVHHDEDAEVFLNGQSIAQLNGFTTEYVTVPLDDSQRSILRKGTNVMAVHCKQTTGGQYIDAHLVDGDNIPELPPVKRDPTPYQSDLITRWGEQIGDEVAWSQYPRPQLQREDWTNLNGSWDYAILPDHQLTAPDTWAGKIRVPFCLESQLGGVKRYLEPSESLWYRRTFEVSKTPHQRTLLHFEAVDYRCEAIVNGQSVGKHQGGNTPFSFDVTAAIRNGENELVVRVEDDTEQWQLRGKQVMDPHGIWYTQVSGIWQTVWMEQVAESYIDDVKITTDASAGTITVRPIVQGNGTVTVTVKDSGRTVAKRSSDNGSIEIAIEDAKLWSPKSPFLYDLELTLSDAAGTVTDRVRSYAGIRTVGKRRDAEGHWRFTLNGNPIFHWGPLDQGWWPDGLLTPPSDEAMLFDIRWLKQAGFNMIRKHIKVEPRRYYYHCDRLGMMVWQDQVSGGHSPRWTRLAPDPSDATWPDEHHQQYRLELERMIDTLENHPSIVVWVPFNEAWGQHRTVEVGRWTAERDPTRLVNIASGGNFWPVGDIVDAHAYPHPAFPFHQNKDDRFAPFIKVMGEFGGHGYAVKGHLWNENRRNWGYGGLPQNQDEYRSRYVESIERLAELQSQGIAAGVYTQTTDVEGEINGLMTYDRKVIKIPAEELKELHQQLLDD